MNPDDIKITEFTWSSDSMNMSDTGFTAQEITSIDLGLVDTITLTGAAAQPTITLANTTTSSYNWANGSSITITDPYEEMEKRLKALEDIIAEEKAIRDNCPAVKNAYDEYRLLLVLAKRTPGDQLTED